MISTKAQLALRYAEQAYQQRPHWIEFHNSLFGNDGAITQLFPESPDRLAFNNTEESARIDDMVVALVGLHPDATGNISLRVPPALHSALLNEAAAKRMTLEHLCLLKLEQAV